MCIYPKIKFPKKSRLYFVTYVTSSVDRIDRHNHVFVPYQSEITHTNFHRFYEKCGTYIENKINYDYYNFEILSWQEIKKGKGK